MRLMTMRFKGFTWKDNPVSLRVENLRQVQETKIPYGDSQAEELGRQRRKVTGEGYFTGEGCRIGTACKLPLPKRARGSCSCRG